MRFHVETRLAVCTASALLLSSCVVKDGSLDFTWWKDAATPVLEDDVVIESSTGQHYRSTPAPEQIPDASIPREESPIVTAPPTPEPVAAGHAAAQQQPAVEPPSNTPSMHKVQKGDTLSHLARRYGTSVRALVAANGMTSANVPLRINQMLVIPRGSTAPARPAGSPGTYIVQPGDTLFGIARRFGVPAAALMQANSLTPESANAIRAGATLRIPASR